MFVFLFLNCELMFPWLQASERLEWNEITQVQVSITMLDKLVPLLIEYPLHPRFGERAQIYKGDPRPCTPPCVMASSATGIKLGVYRFFADHTRRNKRMTNASTIFVHCVAFYGCLSSSSDRSRCKWHTHLTNYGYFDYGRNLKTPKVSPMPGYKWRRF